MNETPLPIDPNMPWSTWANPVHRQVLLGELTAERTDNDELGISVNGEDLTSISKRARVDLGRTFQYPPDFIEDLPLDLSLPVIQHAMAGRDSAQAQLVYESGQIVAITKGWRPVVPAALLAQATYDSCRTIGEVEIQNASSGVNGTDLTFLLPTQKDIKAGDILRAGIRARYVPGVHHEIDLFIYRLWCENGAYNTEQVMSWAKRTEISATNILEWVGTATQLAFSKFEAVCDKATIMANTPIGGEPLQALRDRLRSMNVGRAHYDGILEAFRQEPGDTEWSMLNAITRYATHNEDLGNAQRQLLQRGAGVWQEQFDIVNARLPRPIAIKVGAQIIEG